MTPFPEQPQGPWASRGVTRHEKQMLQFVVDVLDQPGGRELLLTEDGVRALRRQFGLYDVVFEPADTQRYKEKLFLAALRDLKRKTIQSACRGVCAVLDAEFEVLQSDSLISEVLQLSLSRLAGQQAEASGAPWDVSCFLTDDADDREWWGSRAVLDPFMFPAVRGRTRTLGEEGGRIDLERCWQWMGMGDVRTTDALLGTYGEENMPLDFRVLPSEVQFRADGTAQIASYVNGLHPSVGGMYDALERVLDVVIPQWQRVLGSFEDCRRIVPDKAFMGGYMSQLRSAGSGGRLHPTIAVLNQEQREDFKAARMGEEDSLQVIFRIDNIAGEAVYMQDDDKLGYGVNYSRGEWRRPAPFSEEVVAVAIYCYDADESQGSEVRIQLKQDTSPDVYDACNKHPPSRFTSGNKNNVAVRAFNELYNEVEGSPYDSLEGDYPDMDPEKPSAVELLGSVRLAQGRLLVFPASVQHRFWVRGVPSNCGILTMALIDPRRPSRLSTATVPPQSRDYWRAHIRDIPWFRRLPEELWLLINSELDSIKGGGASDGEDDDDDCGQQYPVSRRAAWETRQKVNEARARYEQEIGNTMVS
ncbi:unnamed protein product [Clonostachys rosea f. rosea IK726]|uniref:Uncharacterized protein n=1 Tax=Clonostachys rosea f. rosea IK726 TaxID=1349383 RepID=A0ACA9U7D7_BIOOC|nr:unnamed protein product [Clonostachys rosea f. rosea IK726]